MSAPDTNSIWVGAIHTTYTKNLSVVLGANSMDYKPIGTIRIYKNTGRDFTWIGIKIAFFGFFFSIVSCVNCPPHRLILYIYYIDIISAHF